ncbi:hypothetical protein CR513_26782, partial [Mucuna pruriens]
MRTTFFLIKEDPLHKNHSRKFIKEIKDKIQVMCFECKKLGRFKSECPSLEKEKKKFFFKKKKEEDEGENICLMNEKNMKKSQLQTSYQGLLSNSSTLSIGCIDLKKCSKLSKEFDVLQKENDLLKKNNESLKEEKTQNLSTINTLNINEQLQEEKKDLKKDKSTSHYLNCRRFGHLSYDYRDHPNHLGLTRKDPREFGYLQTCLFLLHICLTQRRRHQSWYLISGCLRQMTGERSMFQDLRPESGRWVTFRGKQKGKIAGIGKINKHIFHSIDNVLFIEGLKHNLLSIDQLCNNEYDRVSCLVSIKDDQWTCHKKIGHRRLRLISKLKKHNIIRGLPSLAYKANLLCDACKKKEIKLEDILSPKTLPFELLHIDLCGLTRTTFMSGKRYGLVVVMFVTHKDESFKVFSIFLKRVQNEKENINITYIKRDRGREFENDNFQKLYKENGILLNFSYTNIHQQNGVKERKNRYL